MGEEFGPGADPQMTVILDRLRVLSGDLADMRSSMAEMAKSVTRLAVMEERQANSREAQERAFREIADLQARLKTLEGAQPVQAQTTRWVNQAIGLLLAAVIGAVATSVIRAPREGAPVPQIERSR